MDVACSGRTSFFLAACLCATVLPAIGFAQVAAPPYPVKVVRVIVPFPPGAGVDIVTRIVVPRLSESMAGYIKVETEKWGKVIKGLGAKVQ